MTWKHDFTTWRLVYRWRKVPLMRFGGRWWCRDGTASGVLIEMTTMLGDVWYVRPEHLLVLRQGFGEFTEYTEPEKATA